VRAREGAGAPGAARFGTFGGVFTPSILTILGLILFMRASYVVGHVGVLAAIAILVIAKSITFLTSLSVSAIATNSQVRGGGAYFLISRALGPEFGGAIGIALYLAVALSVPFYFLGFTEALVLTVPSLEPYFMMISLSGLVVFFGIAYVGASWAIKTQYVIMAILVVAIIAFLGGALRAFSFERLSENLTAATPEGLEALGVAGPVVAFWAAFAIYFPAVTGIDAGLNMSGDLKDPTKSLPRGTLYAVLVGALVYLLQIVLGGGAFPRAELIEQPFRVLADNALFGLGFAVIAGAFAATLSSALGSLLGGPRVLQAVARDDILPMLRPFAKGAGETDEPRRAALLTGGIGVAVLVWAGDASGGGALNAVAAIITMFFLYSYGMINLAAFIEGFSENPSFRPRFRWFHWSSALVGAVGCVAVAALIHWPAALVAAVLIGVLVASMRARGLKMSFGDARRGFVFAGARKSLLRLARTAEDPKNWRPTIIVFSGNPGTRETLTTMAVWLESGCGFVFLSNILTGDIADYTAHRRTAVRVLRELCEEKGIDAFPAVLFAPNLDDGVSALLQTAGIGPLRPNVAMFGWCSDPDRLGPMLRMLRVAKGLEKSLVLVADRGLPAPGEGRRIDVWWRGEKNGGLMLVLAHLLERNWEWRGVTLRLLRVVANEAGREPSVATLRSLLASARVDAEAHVIVSTESFDRVFAEQSRGTDCTFLGFEVPDRDDPVAISRWHAVYTRLLEGAPTTVLVSAQQEGLLVT
jgi:amino acid transporter